jgi:hypothetical protein
MVEQDQLNPFEDSGFGQGLIGEIEQHLQKERQIKNSLIAQFLVEHVFVSGFDLTKEPKDLGSVLYHLFPNWKDILLRLADPQEVSEEKKNHLRGLTLNNIADYSSAQNRYYSQKLNTAIAGTDEYKKVEDKVTMWSKVALIAGEAAKLEKDGTP